MLNHNFNKMDMDYQRKIGTCQATVECDMDTSSKGGVSKLLSVCADVKITGIEAGDTEAKVSGAVNVKVICIDEEMQLQSYDYLNDFNVKIKGVLSETALSAEGSVIDIDSSIIGGRIRVQAVCEISLFGVITSSNEALYEAEQVIVRMQDATYNKIADSVNHQFAIVEEYECGVTVDKVLLFDTSVIATAVKVADGALIITGEAVATVVYESDSVITTKTFNIPYSEECSVKSESGKADVNVCISDSRIVLSGGENDNVMRLELTAQARGEIYCAESATIITDLCSPHYEIDFKRDEIEYSEFCARICLKDKIAGSAELSDDIMAVRKILSATSSRNCITALHAGDGSVTVEGVMTCNVIYEDTDAMVNCVEIELPYCLPFDSEQVSSADILKASVIVEILSAKVKRDREIDVTALITISISVRRQRSINIITSLTVGEEKECDLKAITVYRTEAGETAWDVAKAISAPIEEIIEQNPSLADGVIHGQKIIFYRQI